VLAPSVTAAVVDIAVRGLFTSEAMRRPEVARRRAAGKAAASAMLTLVDDPTAPGAYGGFAFDDEGAPAAPITLLAGGRVVGRLARGRRAGHLGSLAAEPSHLVLAPGAFTLPQLSGDGWLLEGRVTAAFDPSSDQLVVGVARARELHNGADTGRVFPDVELVADLASLLANVDGVGQDSATIPLRDERDGAPLWRSIAAPYVRTRGVVRGGRLA
jgi:predicted Zn-dependent protease